MMKKLLVLSLALFMAIPWSAMAGGGAEKPAAPKILKLQWHASIGTDSVFECPWQDQQCLVHDMIFDTLLKVNSDGVTYVPRLAKSWKVSADGKTYTFTLVDNAKWHDGTPVSAEDVLFTFNTMPKVPEASFKQYITMIDGYADVIGKKADAMKGLSASGNTVTFTLIGPDSFFLKALCQVPILPRHLLKDVDPTLFTKYQAYWKKPVGCGAYRIDEVSFPNYFTVVRNESYYGTKPNIPKALFTSYATGGNEAVIAALIAGNLDYAYGNAANDINNAKNMVAKNPDLVMKVVPATYTRTFRFNNVGSSDGKYNADVQKAEVRQAIHLLIDRDAIVNFYKGQAVALSTYVHPQNPAYNTSIPLFKRDVAKAKELLAAAKFDFSRPLRILYYYNDQTSIDVMELVKQNLAEGGIKAEPFLATGDLASIIYKVRNWDMIYCAAAKPDPILIYSVLVPDNGQQDGLFGDLAFRNATFRPLLERYSAATDPAEIKKVGDQIQMEASKYALDIPVYVLNKICVLNASRLKMDEGIFKTDLFNMIDNKFDKWELLK